MLPDIKRAVYLPPSPLLNLTEFRRRWQSLPQIEGDRLTCKKQEHNRCDRKLSGAQQHMGVITHQHPCVTAHLLLREELGQPFEKILTVLVIHKNCRLFDSTNNKIKHSSGSINARLAWHAFRLLG